VPRSPALNDLMRGRAVAAIQQAALDAFAAGGFHGGSMTEIARRAGVAKGLIYNYFPSKEALLVALLRDRLGAAMAAPDDATASPAARLRARVERTVTRAVDERDLYRVYFGLLLQPDMAPLIGRAESAMRGELEDEVRRLAALFTELSDRPDLDLLLFQMALNGLALMLLVRPELLDHRDAFPLDALQARLVELFARAGRAGDAPIAPTAPTAPTAAASTRTPAEPPRARRSRRRS